MELRLLQYFLQIVADGSFTKAAENLGVTQPTLSKQIQVLEDEVQAKLFYRNGRSISLTPAGEILRKHATHILQIIHTAVEEIQQSQGIERGSIRIGCSGNHILIRVVALFNQLYPQVDIMIYDQRSQQTIEGLLRGELDLGVIFFAQEDNRLEFVRLYEEEFFLVVTEGNPYAAVESVTVHDLVDIPLVLFPKHFLIRKFIDEFCAAYGVTLTPKVQLSSLESQREILTHGNVATILTGSYLQLVNDPKLRAVRILEGHPRRWVGIVYPRSVRLSEIQQKFIECAVQLLRK